jgi:DNA polymerase
MIAGILEAKTYPEFKQKLADSACTRCGLAAGRTRIVVDRGNPKADTLFIGEAPGANEDIQGRAFVGRGGKLLDAMMKDEGFDTEEDCLIVNVVKCRPPDNRRPEPEEARECAPFLKRQIEHVKPRFILLLGATALAHIAPEKKGFKMNEEAGKFFTHPDYPGARLMVLFHPAYILRDPRKKPLMKQHIQRFVAAHER